MSIIETHLLTRSYGARRGIEELTLMVDEGTLFGFLGPNGAGKTTAIRVMVGLLRPTSGWARIFGLDCWSQGREIKAEVGYVPGDLRLPAWLSGGQALSLWERIRRRKLVPYGKELAERFELDMRVKVRNMSRGMRQKLGLILALAHRPRLLILDEPTVTLDPLMQSLVHLMLREMAAAGHTIFFSSHTLNEVDQLCDRVAMIRNGRLVANESLATLRQHAGHEVIIHWQDGSAAATLPPPFLRLEQRDGLIWRGMLDGPVDQLVGWLAGRPFADLNIVRPDLDTLFRHYYASETATP